MSDDQLFELNNVEIFRTGTWNGDKYTVRDLDDIVDSFSKQGFQVPIKLGHKEESGDKAFGWVKGIRRIGDKLIADFGDLSENVYNAIKSRSFDSVSSEIFFNLKRGTDVFRRALKAVALLGAEIPAVAGLKPLRESFTLPTGLMIDSIHAHTLDREDFKMTDAELQIELTKSQEQIKQLTADLEASKKKETETAEFKKLQAEYQNTVKELKEMQDQARTNSVEKILESIKVPAYREYLRPLAELSVGGSIAKEYKIGDKQLSPKDLTESLIARINEDAEKMFKTVGGKPVKQTSGKETESDNPADELDSEVQAYMKEHSTDDYMKATRSVLAADPDLAERYNNMNSGE